MINLKSICFISIASEDRKETSQSFQTVTIVGAVRGVVAVVVICATVCLVIRYRHKRSQSVNLQYSFEWCDIWSNSIRFSWVVDVDEDIIFFSNEWMINRLFLQMIVGINRIFKVKRIFVKVDFISSNSEVVVILYSPVTLICAVQINDPSF